MAGRNERAADISDFLEEVVSDESVRVGIYIFNQLVTASAVRDGILRASFLPTISNPTNATVDTPDKSGQPTISKGVSIISSAKNIKYPTIYIQNNQPYAYRIMETGYSEQTPPKTLSLTIQAAVNI
tara:strand:+ start:2126 stop:2506 length:381 start_codon:yes stop_codon:yes gene_type:complete